ncbi:MAG: FAD-dependent oxidoreductase [Chloroflexi bacterium]|nr:FAD-dependent oxidoreductase [Chloroflexota bacterium]
MDSWDLETDVVVVGAGGAGLVAALAAAEHRARVLVVEKEERAGGNTGISAGLVVAAGSHLQRAAGESGTPEELAADAWEANGHTSDRDLTLALCRASGPVIDWMMDRGVPFEWMSGYRYPGHSRAWLHAPRERHGEPIIAALLSALARQPRIDLRLGTPATGLATDETSAVTGIRAAAVAGEPFAVRAGKVILAADGFGANREMVARFIPAFSEALYYGAAGCTGDAIAWGMDLGAATAFMDSFQPHSSIAYPERIFVTTFLVNNGAIQVNCHGSRFSDETKGYGEHALAVQRQPGRRVYEIFDRRIREAAEASYARFGECVNSGALVAADTLEELANQLSLPPGALQLTIAQYHTAIARGHDEFGRRRFGKPLVPPFYGIAVTSALFHTQGGLVIDAQARVQHTNGKTIGNLYAAGGTAAGFSGNGCGGYLAGMGLLSAYALGKIAGDQAASALV